MKSTSVEFKADSVVKYSTSPEGDIRLAAELNAYEMLDGSPHIARLIEATTSHGTERASLEIERIHGPTINQELGIGSNWKGNAHTWEESSPVIGQFAEAQIDFLARGALYRDLSLHHVYVPSYLQRAILIDLECTVVTRRTANGNSITPAERLKQ
jgi:hypothetical protein